MSGFESLFNVRDLGGKAGKDDADVPSGVLLRSAASDLMTPADVRRLRDEMHVTCIVDLRSKMVPSAENSLDDVYTPCKPDDAMMKQLIEYDPAGTIKPIPDDGKHWFLPKTGTCRRVLLKIVSANTIRGFLTHFLMNFPHTFLVLLPLFLIKKLTSLIIEYNRTKWEIQADKRDQPPSALKAKVCAVRSWCHFELVNQFMRSMGGLAGLYKVFLSYGGDRMCAVLKYITMHLERNGKESLMFHCQSGKDRTGLIAALLLTALHVDTEHVIQDYAVSHAFGCGPSHRVVLGIAEELWINKDIMMRYPLLEEYYGAPEATIRGIHDWMRTEYGSVPEYLDSIGFHEVWRHRLHIAVMMRESK
ncbi:hypothetical protein FVE85_3542 [Porphyridium purpureum]|uniref:Tyrosine specific protein phosphatases domain-containing protein n=1 Tax=Porphyridium purpureum TaxID=35688 RepID=A0A5J4YN29_PORPP|nr:hypothetical protein FVE85_3542 [Porphyridium purpureum]|eukprot:POR6122..scf249_10